MKALYYQVFHRNGSKASLKQLVYVLITHLRNSQQEFANTNSPNTIKRLCKYFTIILSRVTKKSGEVPFLALQSKLANIFFSNKSNTSKYCVFLKIYLFKLAFGKLLKSNRRAVINGTYWALHKNISVVQNQKDLNRKKSYILTLHTLCNAYIRLKFVKHF